MKTKKLLKKGVMSLAVAALVCALLPLSALAKVTDDIVVDNNAGYTPTAKEVSGVSAKDASHISKIVWSSALANFDRTWSYSFAAQSCNGYDASSAKADMPALSTQSVRVSNANKIATSTDGSSAFYRVNHSLSYLKTGTSTAEDTFSHAGEYVYLVTESVPALAAWTDSQAEYTMRVYVANKDAGLEIQGITVNRNIDDAGATIDDNDYVYDESKVGTGVDAKVDPTDPNTPEDGDSWNAMAGWEYLSVYEPLSDLSIQLETSGAYADHSLDFALSAYLSRAAYTQKYDKANSFTGVVIDSNGTAQSAVSFEYGKNSSFALKHGYKLVFDGVASYNGVTSSKLPAATMYGYAQEAAKGYSNSTNTKSSAISSALSSTGIELGKALTLDYAKTSDVTNPQQVKAATAIIGQNSGNYSKVINAIDIVPTDASTSSILYIVAIAVLLALLISSALFLHRKSSKKQN